MTDLIGFATCDLSCEMDFSWDLYRGLHNTTIQEAVLPNHVIQWYQLPFSKNFGSDEKDVPVATLSNSEYNCFFNGTALFQLNLNDEEAIMFHGGDTVQPFLDFSSRNFQTDYDSTESALKIL